VSEAEPPQPPRKPNPIDRPFAGHRAPVRFAGIVYQFLERENRWCRFVLRRYADGGSYWSLTSPLYPAQAYCFHCLRQTGFALSRGDRVAYQCQHPGCGLQSWEIPDPEPAPDTTDDMN
jgi:hypothetical protein